MAAIVTCVDRVEEVLDWGVVATREAGGSFADINVAVDVFVVVVVEKILLSDMGVV